MVNWMKYFTTENINEGFDSIFYCKFSLFNNFIFVSGHFRNNMDLYLAILKQETGEIVDA